MCISMYTCVFICLCVYVYVSCHIDSRYIVWDNIIKLIVYIADNWQYLCQVSVRFVVTWCLNVSRYGGYIQRVSTVE